MDINSNLGMLKSKAVATFKDTEVISSVLSLRLGFFIIPFVSGRATQPMDMF